MASEGGVFFEELTEELEEVCEAADRAGLPATGTTAAVAQEDVTLSAPEQV